ncbi:MAG: hypothetical protein ABJA87_00050 [bacterium]
MNAAAGNVAGRARALLEPVPPRRNGVTAVITALALASSLSAVNTGRDTEHRFEKSGLHLYPITVTDH